MGVAERLMLSVWAFTMRFSKGSEKVSDSRYLGIGRSALLAGIAIGGVGDLLGLLDGGLGDLRAVHGGRRVMVGEEARS